MRLGLRLYRTGHCRHPECTTMRGGRWSAIDFPMHAAVLDRDGELTVVDPGYAPRFLQATEPFPDRLYRWTTPASCPPGAALAAQLAREGRLQAVRRVVVTHFHADHVAGLLDFPEAEIVCSRAAWDDLVRRRGFTAVRRGYLRTLAPDALASRVRFEEELPRRTPSGGLASLEAGWDLFGDGSLLLTPLPGHSAGQIGAAFAGEDGRTRLLAADAAWSAPALAADRPPPWITRAFLGSPGVYMQTWRRLRDAMAADPELVVIPAHCTAAAEAEGALA